MNYPSRLCVCVENICRELGASSKLGPVSRRRWSSGWTFLLNSQPRSHHQLGVRAPLPVPLSKIWLWGSLNSRASVSVSVTTTRNKARNQSYWRPMAGCTGFLVPAASDGVTGGFVFLSFRKGQWEVGKKSLGGRLQRWHSWAELSFALHFFALQVSWHQGLRHCSLNLCIGLHPRAQCLSCFWYVVIHDSAFFPCNFLGETSSFMAKVGPLFSWLVSIGSDFSQAKSIIFIFWHFSSFLLRDFTILSCFSNLQLIFSYFKILELFQWPVGQREVRGVRSFAILPP